ncbi:MAG: OB-fold nucleic acid binding domain-containing protein [Candidatus Micrarchaeota archaeon]|nr:OB-fold nucleic acid binding domain-containing protein [Candidatus Micrarchaeota archaeon]
MLIGVDVMKISELKAGAGNVDVEGEISSKEEPRDVVTKFGKKLRVANATLKDDSGEIALSLWNEDADSYSAGDRIKVEKGYVSEYKGNLQLSAGKYGKIVKLPKE